MAANESKISADGYTGNETDATDSANSSPEGVAINEAEWTGGERNIGASRGVAEGHSSSQ